jgi:hypothetical protein
MVGRDPQAPAPDDVDPSIRDVLFPHPVYGRQAWLSVVNPAERTSSAVLELLRSAQRDAEARHERRTTLTPERHPDPSA